MKVKLVAPLALVAAVAVAVLAPTVEAKGGTRIALKAASGFAGASGKAKYQAAGQRELEVEVEHIRRLAGKRVSFFVNSTKIGTARVNGLGAARVDRRGSTFPAIQSGTRIKVRTAGGSLIVAGRF
jgi:hypothetical protein